MAWETEMVELLRIMINDMDVPYKYTDTRLQKVIVSAMQTALFDADYKFITTYTPDILTLSITPDPCDRTTGFRDEALINLTLLKAGCFIDNCVARDAARKGGISIREWNTSLDTKGLFASAMAILEKGWCANYSETLFLYLSGNSAAGAAVLGPFRTLRNAYSGGGYPYDGSLFDTGRR